MSIVSGNCLAAVLHRDCRLVIMAWQEACITRTSCTMSFLLKHSVAAIRHSASCCRDLCIHKEAMAAELPLRIVRVRTAEMCLSLLNNARWNRTSGRAWSWQTEPNKHKFAHDVRVSGLRGVSSFNEDSSRRWAL